MSKDETWLGRLFVVLQLLVVVLGVPIAISKLVETYQADPNQTAQILLILALLALLSVWTIAAYQGFLRKRKWGRVVSFGLALLAIVWLAYDRHQDVQPPTQLLILVSRFEGVDPEKHQVTNTIIADLSDALKEQPTIVVRELPQVITEAQGSSAARETAKQEKATILIWGWYRASETPPELRLHVEILPNSGYRRTPPKIQDYKQTITMDEWGTITERATFPDGIAFLSPLVKGIALNLDGQWQKALGSLNVAYEETKELGKESAKLGDQINFYLAVSCEYLNYDCAANYSQLLDSNSPEPAVLHSNLGNVYLRKGEFTAALDQYDQAVAADPTLGTAFANRGLLHALRGDPASALRDYQQALRLHTDDDALFYLNLAQFYYTAANFQQAQLYYDRSIQLHDTAQARYQRGIFFQRRGQPNEAKADFEKALKLTDVSENTESLRKALDSLGTP